MLQSDHAETHHGDFFINGNGKLLAHMIAPGFHYEIKHANHYSFTDAPFFFAPPGRWLLARVMGGGRGPAATRQATADILAAFLTGPLTGALRPGCDRGPPSGGARRRGGAEGDGCCDAEGLVQKGRPAIADGARRFSHSSSTRRM